MNSNNRYPAEIIAAAARAAQRWSGSFLLKSLDAERTAYAQRKAGRGIRLVSTRGVVVVARTVRGEALPISNYSIARFAR